MAGARYHRVVRDDVELLDAWREGDAAAGEQLVARHFDGVCRFFRTKVSDGVDDLLQRTFLRCVKARERLRPGSSFRAFLYTAARNELIDHFRRERVRGEARVDLSMSSVADLGRSPASLMAEDEGRRLLIAALQRIPVELQIALELYYWENLSGPELAAVLEVPQGTVRSRLRRGVEALRARMRELADSPEQLQQTLQSLDAWAAAVRELADED